MKISLTLMIAAVLCGWAGWLPARTFTDNSGRTVEAEVSEIKGDAVILQLSNGGKSTVPLAKLSAADLMYIGVWQKEKEGKQGPGKAATFTPATGALVPATPTNPVAGGGANSAPLPANHKFRLKVVVNPIKKTKGSNQYYYDNKEVRSTLKVDIRNEEIDQSLNKAKARLVSFSRDLRDKNILAVLHCEDYDLNLKPGETFSQETEEIKLQFYDSSDYKYGHKYYGHLLVIQLDGKTILMETSQPSLGEHAEKIWKLGKGVHTNEKLEPAKTQTR